MIQTPIQSPKMSKKIKSFPRATPLIPSLYPQYQLYLPSLVYIIILIQESAKFSTDLPLTSSLSLKSKVSI